MYLGPAENVMYAKLSLLSLLSGRNLNGSYTCTLSAIHSRVYLMVNDMYTPQGSPKHLVDDGAPVHRLSQMYLHMYIPSSQHNQLKTSKIKIFCHHNCISMVIEGYVIHTQTPTSHCKQHIDGRAIQAAQALAWALFCESVGSKQIISINKTHNNLVSNYDVYVH